VEKRRVYVLGLDGATFDILVPYMSAGKMPNLDKMKRNGAWGLLESVTPPFSAPAWVTFATGKNPGNHKVFDFWLNDYGRATEPLNSLSYGATPIWSILSDYMKRVAVLNVPMTYPPQPVNGVMVTGLMTPSPKSEYTYPPELRQEIAGLMSDYDPSPYGAADAQTVSFLQHVRECVKRTRRLLGHLLTSGGDFDLLVCVVQASDVVQHHFWKHLDENHPLYDRGRAATLEPHIEDCYQEMDALVGDLLSQMKANDLLIVMSDHGFGPIDRVVHINKWLVDLGLLSFKRDVSDRFKMLLNRHGFTLDHIVQLAKRLDRAQLARKMIGRRRRQVREGLDRSLGPTIDWSQTQAYSGGLTSEAIYINLKGRDKYGIVSPGREYEDLRDYIAAEAHKLYDPITNSPIFEAIRKREDLYRGPYVESAPDLLLIIGDHPYLVDDKLVLDQLIEPVSPTAVTGRHRPIGVFLAFGDTVSCQSVETLHLADIAPTILYYLGIPVKEDMDGQVHTELFNRVYGCASLPRDANRTRQDTSSLPDAYTSQDIELIKQRLEDLGYL